MDRRPIGGQRATPPIVNKAPRNERPTRAERRGNHRERIQIDPVQITASAFNLFRREGLKQPNYLFTLFPDDARMNPIGEFAFDTPYRTSRVLLLGVTDPDRRFSCVR
jgi:hypothetical protein